jgi:hypothetical protein
LGGSNETYANLEGQLSAITAERDALAAQIIQLLEGAEFSGTPIDFKTASTLAAKAEELLEKVQLLNAGL